LYGAIWDHLHYILWSSVMFLEFSQHHDSGCRFCIMVCPDFGWVIIYPHQTMWWRQWVVITAHHCCLWCRWWSHTLWATLIRLCHNCYPSNCCCGNFLQFCRHIFRQVPVACRILAASNSSDDYEKAFVIRYVTKFRDQNYCSWRWSSKAEAESFNSYESFFSILPL
jgi:hypothetical protein